MGEREQASGQEKPATSRPEPRPVAAFWQWFAVGVLILCWLAEASLCAARGT